MEKLFNLPLFREFKKIASFGAIGAVNAVVDYAVFTLLLFLFVWFNKAEESNLLIAFLNFCAWAVAVTGSYIMNSKITFKNETGGMLSLNSYFKFAGAGVLGLIANTCAVLLAKMFMPLLLAKLLAIGVSFVVNFTMAKFFVFKK